MKDTISKLKGKVYGQIYEEYIVDYILFRRNELNLYEYISDDVILNHLKANLTKIVWIMMSLIERLL